ncbi:Biphenyl dioxygenase subunit alpha [Mycobacterium simulans]|uniref:aromatic ring-hydroxylating oxygenase subunit alpha n=1 Tax=Mycobacterium simulans TaxID=627089 RepID=UPI0019AC9A2F|nr:SRPBCC family protein [Mycobacterium simulans]SON63682.1 Biphenyl dioxygenase subunit alpha [Mycobacterium simulans]
MAASGKFRVADDLEIIRRVLAHIEAGTTDEGEAWREPVQNYLQPSRFAKELRLLRCSPSVFIPSAAIPNPGDHVERISFGVPLFAVRGRDRQARVFRNACRHRAMALVAGAGCSRALVCRYHGWTYRLDGELAHIPHAGGFPDLDMSTRGLVEIASREVDGLVVIDALDDHGTDSLPRVTDAARELTDGSPWADILVSAEHLVFVESIVQQINWKILVEQFLEGYHIRSTHRDTFYPGQYDNLSIVETFGPNSRITFPYRNIERLRQRPTSTWTVGGRLTYVYHLFPNTIVATLPDRVAVIAIDPVGVDRSTVTTYVMTTPGLAERARQATVNAVPYNHNASVSSVLHRGAVEDNEMSAGVQRGLRAGASAFVEFGRHESAIGHFHAVLEERLARL